MEYGQQQNQKSQPETDIPPQPPVPPEPLPQTKSTSRIIITSLSILLVAAIGVIAYLLLASNSKPRNTPSSSTQTKSLESASEETLDEQVQKAIKNPKPLQSFSYEGWNTYPKDVEKLFEGIMAKPSEEDKRIYGDVTFSFPAHWRYTAGIDMIGLGSGLRTSEEIERNNDPYATMTFGWWRTDNTNGFENAVISLLENITYPGAQPDSRYTHKLREIGTNNHGKMTAIIDYTYKLENGNDEVFIYRGVLGVVDDIRPTYSSSTDVSLASSKKSELAADPYQGAKEILSVIRCAGENMTDTQLSECIGIIKSYDKPNRLSQQQS